MNHFLFGLVIGVVATLTGFGLLLWILRPTHEHHTDDQND